MRHAARTSGASGGLDAREHRDMRAARGKGSFRHPTSARFAMDSTIRSLTVRAAFGVVLLAACTPAADDTKASDSVGAAADAAAPAAVSPTAATTPVDSLLIAIYKTPTCGCCRNWVDHVRENGFHATTTDVADVTPVKTTHKVPADLQSCHTALIGGYVVEGHVPADDIKRLLKERPDIIGIAVPGMPSGSPGMETGQIEKYDVIAIGKDGSRKVWASHGQ
jgi:hypothetical protein